jgi:hypothetical protein
MSTFTDKDNLSFEQSGTKWHRRVSLVDGILGGTTYDYGARVLTDSDTETYTFRSGGAAGTIVAVIVINYTDSTLETILNFSRTT